MRDHTGNTQNQIANEEHEAGVMPPTKRVLPYGYDGSAKNLLFVDANGIQRSIVTIASAINTSFSGNVTLNPSSAHIGSVSIYGNLAASLAGNVTLNPSPNFIGLVTVANAINTYAQAVDDAGNSTTTPLNANITFTGTGFDLHQYASWSVTIFSDQASSTNGLKVQWSNDNSNWDFVDQQTYVASAGNMIMFGRKARYVRLVYTNGGTNQTIFRVAAFAQPISVRQTRKFVGNQLVDQDTGQVVIAGLQGHTTAGGGSWVDVKVNPSGALTVDSTFASNVTLNPSSSFIGLVSTASIHGKVDVINFPALTTGSNWIGFATVAIGSTATLFAVVNTGSSGGNVTLNPGPSQIGSVTVSNPITLGSVVTTVAAPYSFYQQASLISGYTFLGFTAPGNAPNTATFRIQRSTANTGEVLFASGVATYIHTWSAASLASISYL